MIDDAWLFEVMANTAAIALAYLEADGRIIEANACFGKLVGLSGNNLKGMSTAHSFASPTLSELLLICQRVPQQRYAGLLTLQAGEHESLSLNAIAHYADGRLHLAAEPDIAQLLLINDSALSLSTQLSQTQRELQLTCHKLKLKESQILQLSLTDGLTGVANRRRLDEALPAEISHAARLNRTVALAVMDIDHFKRINDGFGHLAGDTVIQAFATAVKETIRSSDLLARYGGDEFVVVMPNTTMDAAVDCGERIRSCVANLLCVREAGSLTASVGIALSRVDDDAASLFARADRALYAAKEAGRNRVVGFDDSPAAINIANSTG